MYLECPDSVRVFSSQIPEISGFYSKTSQTRRQKPVWYNNQKDRYIYLSIVNEWHIAKSENYNADNPYCFAYADGNNTSCPQDLDYKVWVINKWTSETNLLVTSGKHDFYFLKCNLIDSSLK